MLIYFSVVCVAGEEPAEVGETCEVCAIGSYSTITDGEACSVCPDSQTTLLAGSTLSTDCYRE